jgi:hypothetical protein
LLALGEALHNNPDFLRAWEPGRTALAHWAADCLDWGARQGIYRDVDREQAIQITITLLISVASETILGPRFQHLSNSEHLVDTLAVYCGNALFQTPQA